MIYQAQEKGCGYASIKMMLKHNGVKRAEELQEPLISGQAPSLGELIAFAKDNGLLLGGYQFLEPSGLRQCAYFPICLLIEEDGLEHMVFVKGKGRRSYTVLDPAKGKRKFSFEELEKISKGVYLRQLGFEEETTRDYISAKRVSETRHLCFALFPLIEVILALGGISCLREGGSFPLLILFALGYFATITGRSWALLNEMKCFDKEFSEGCLGKGESERQNLLQHYCAYKRSYLLPKICLSEDLLGFAFLFFLLAVNDPFFGLLSLAPVMFSCLSRIFFDEAKEKEKEKMERLETDFISKKEETTEKRKGLDVLLASSYSFAEKESCSRIIEVCLCAFSSSVCLLWGSVSSNRFLFCLFSSLYLLRQLEAIYKDADMVEEEKREKPYFLLHFCSAIVSKKNEQNDTMTP